MTTITTSGRTVRIASRTTGRNFGYVGEVKALNGRVIATTVSYATAETAEAAAAELGETL